MEAINLITTNATATTATATTINEVTTKNNRNPANLAKQMQHNKNIIYLTKSL